MSKNLRVYLAENVERGVIDFHIRAERRADGVVSFYIHPRDRDGETVDFLVFSVTGEPTDQGSMVIARPTPAGRRAGESDA